MYQPESDHLPGQNVLIRIKSAARIDLDLPGIPAGTA
jgi:hypothetical protein